MIRNFLSLVVALGFISSNAFAVNLFREMTEAYHNHGSSLYSESVLYSLDEGTLQLTTPEIDKLQAIAQDLAGIWVDTILEGDYHTAGPTVLEEITAVYKAGQLIGYKIQYAEHAWYTGNCSFDGEDEKSLAGCQEGTIRESSFVSADFTDFTRNLNDLADFYEN